MSEVHTLLQQDPWLVKRHSTLTLRVPKWGHVIIDTSRFGRPFRPFRDMLRIARLNKQLSETDLAKALDKDRSVICRLEGATNDKLHASSDVVQHIAIGLGLDPFESYVAYVADVRPFFRVVSYPDDPGPLGSSEFGLPLPGFETRLLTRPK